MRPSYQQLFVIASQEIATLIWELKQLAYTEDTNHKYDIISRYLEFLYHRQLKIIRNILIQESILRAYTINSTNVEVNIRSMYETLSNT